MYSDEEKVFETEHKCEIAPGVSAEYLLNAIADAHPVEKGWELGESHIELGVNGKRYLVVPLKKYPVNSNGKSR